jgi:hypothetical protein
VIAQRAGGREEQLDHTRVREIEARRGILEQESRPLEESVGPPGFLEIYIEDVEPTPLDPAGEDPIAAVALEIVATRPPCAPTPGISSRRVSDCAPVESSFWR